ncbi:hypothetical protein Tco_0940708 [Tanacetum coccineum]|uniref:Uncharacterized protein n=1 Tax=Tanacetum coccineum TaxID=301880 RepID=A0ABQ5DRB8_9ASTR
MKFLLESLTTRIKEQVKDQLSQILPKEMSNFTPPVIEELIKESRDEVTLAKVSSQPHSTYKAASTLTEFELKNILLDKMEKSESYLATPEHRDCYDSLKNFMISTKIFSSLMITNHVKKKDSTSGSSKGSKSQPKSSGKSGQSEEPVFKVADSDMPQDKKGNMGDNEDELRKEIASRCDWTNLLKGTHSNYAKLEYDFEECYKALSEKLDWENPEGGDYPFDLSKPFPLIKRGKHQRVPFEFFINNDLNHTCQGYEETWIRINDIEDMFILVVQNRLINLSGDDVANFAKALRMFTRSLVIQKRVEDLQLGVESYQKNINVTKPDTIRLDLRKRHPYTPYRYPQGFIYVDDHKRNRLMRSDKLYKFSYGTLTRLLSSLEDITKNIDMEYLPKRRWSNLEKKRAHFMIKDINMLLKEKSSLVVDSTELTSDYCKEQHDFVILCSYLKEHPSDFIHYEDGILLKITSNKLMEYLKMVMERQSVKVKEIQERCIIKAFQDYQIKKGMSMSVQKSQVHEMAKFVRWQNEIILG